MQIRKYRNFVISVKSVCMYSFHHRPQGLQLPHNLPVPSPGYVYIPVHVHAYSIGYILYIFINASSKGAMFKISGQRLSDFTCSSDFSD